jgi:hypothetical protein
MSIVCGSTGAAIGWTFSGEDNYCGIADSFAVIVTTDRQVAFEFTTPPPPWMASTYVEGSGTEYCVERTGLQRGTKYYFAVRIKDAANQASAVTVDSCTTASTGWYNALCEGGYAYYQPPEEESGSVGMTVEVPSEMELGIAGGNPMKQAGIVTFGIPSWGQGKSYEVAVFDVAGRRVGTLERGTAKAGRYQKDMRDRGIQPRGGVYFVRLTLDGQRLSRTVVVTP